MEINIKLPVAAVTALENIAHELKELRLGLCPPLRAGNPKPVDRNAPSQVQYPRDYWDQVREPEKYWNAEPPVERRGDRE